MSPQASPAHLPMFTLYCAEQSNHILNSKKFKEQMFELVTHCTPTKYVDANSQIRSKIHWYIRATEPKAATELVNRNEYLKVTDNM